MRSIRLTSQRGALLSLPSLNGLHEYSGRQQRSPRAKLLHRCFVEEFTAYRLQKLMPAEITIREIPLAERPAELPERFRVTLTRGGHLQWKILYHISKFEET